MSSINKLKKIRVVGFDFDDTLVDEAYSLKNRWGKVLKQYSYLSENLEKVFFQIFEQSGHKYKFHLTDTFKKLKIDQKNIRKIVDDFLKTPAIEERLINGVEDVLSHFKKKGIVKVIITNGKRSYQEKRIQNSGILKYMDFIFYGDTHKKPNVEVFSHCLSTLKIKPYQFLYVGNHLEEDIISASSLGIKTCWITKEPKSKKLPKDTLKFASFKKFLQFLENL